jgi:hypothetical protein
MRNIILLLALSLPACSSVPNKELDAEKDAAMKGVVACQFAAARSLDDKHSDATSIGVAVVGSCHKEYMEFQELNSRELNDQARIIYMQKLRDEGYELASATRAVLMERANTNH